MAETELLLNEILIQLKTISIFNQLFIYGIVLTLIIYFGYWFFSRFFY